MMFSLKLRSLLVTVVELVLLLVIKFCASHKVNTTTSPALLNDTFALSWYDINYRVAAVRWINCLVKCNALTMKVCKWNLATVSL